MYRRRLCQCSSCREYLDRRFWEAMLHSWDADEWMELDRLARGLDEANLGLRERITHYSLHDR
jgi:hypothetical protein